MASSRPGPLLHSILDRLPLRPLNCTTFATTKLIAGDVSHPLHIRTQRRLEIFDPQGFYWRVSCPTDISKKAVIRNTCTGEFKKAFIWALAEAGFNKYGKPLDRQSKKERLTGAVLLAIVKDPERVLTAKKADVRRDAAKIVRNIIARQDRPIWNKRPLASETHRNVASMHSKRSMEDSTRSMANATASPSHGRYTPARTQP